MYLNFSLLEVKFFDELFSINLILYTYSDIDLMLHYNVTKGSLTAIRDARYLS